MDALSIAPAGWIAGQTAEGAELRCTRRAGQGRPAAWIFIVILAAVCGYGASVFLSGWWEGQEILAGEVVLFVLLTGGLVAGLFQASAMFRTTTYRLGPQRLTITTTQPIFGRRTQQIDRSSILEVIRLASPSPGSGEVQTWRTMLALDRPNRAEPAWIALEGESDNESAWLAARVADWAGRGVRVQQNDAA